MSAMTAASAAHVLLPALSGTELTQSLTSFEEFVSGRILIWLLLAVGLYLTIRTRGVQVRLFGRAVHLVARSRHQPVELPGLRHRVGRTRGHR